MDGGWEPPPSCSFLPQQYQGMQVPAPASPWDAIYHGGARPALDLPGFPVLDPDVGSSDPMLYANRFQPYPLQQQPPQPPLPLPQPQPQPQTPRERSSGNETVVKKPRGRPRKYALVPANDAEVGSVGSATGGGRQPDAPVVKRPRGRPPGTGRRQQLGDQGKVVSISAGTGPTPHMLVTSAGEDVTTKVHLFSQQAARSLCVLSAFGTLSRVTIFHPSSGSVLTYKGFFDIISLSGSYASLNVNGSKNQSFRLNICVSGPDGKLIAGGVGGPLIAASPVQVVLLSYKFFEKKAQNKSMAPDEHTTTSKASEGVEVGTPSSSLTQNIAHDASGSFSDQHQELKEQ